MKKRMKNPWFWVGLVGIVLMAMDINPETLTNWGMVAQAFRDMVSNPFLLGSAAIAVLGVFVDPTTDGLRDHRED